MRLFPIAASRGEAADAANRVSQRQPRRKRIASSQRGHVMLADIPPGAQKRSNQSAGKNSSSLQCGDAENIRRMRRVVAPLINDIEHLRAHNPAQYHQNPEVPCLLAVNPQPLGVAHADPQSDQHSQRNQEAISRQEKSPEMHKLRIHSYVGCRNAEICT